MSTILADACTVKIKNIYNAEEVSESQLPLAQLDGIAEDEVYNTGLSAVGDPHSDEDYANAGKAIITTTDTWVAKHIAALRLYRNNCFITLNPGDEVDLVTKSGEETLYYLGQATDMIEVTIDGGASV